MYHLTYLSAGLRVKGYLVFPRGFGLSRSDLLDCLTQYYGTPELPITEIAAPIKPGIEDVRKRKWPVLIYCRGGMGKVGSVKTLWLEQFSRHGFLVFAPSYRGTEGGEGRDQFGGDDQEDVISAYRMLENLPFVDPHRISLMGFSRGSVNAAQTVSAIPEAHKLIHWSGVSDLAQTYEERVDLRKMLKRVIGGSPGKMPEAYRDRSPIHMAERIVCPVLVIHGTDDVQVDFSHGVNLYRKLKELGKDVEFHRYEGYGHHFPDGIFQQAVERMFEWLRK